MSQPSSEPEFDDYAEDYEALHEASIKASGESPEYFSRYKAQCLVDRGLAGRARVGFEYLDQAPVITLSALRSRSGLGELRFHVAKIDFEVARVNARHDVAHRDLIADVYGAGDQGSIHSKCQVDLLGGARTPRETALPQSLDIGDLYRPHRPDDGLFGFRLAATAQ